MGSFYSYTRTARGNLATILIPEPLVYKCSEAAPRISYQRTSLVLVEPSHGASIASLSSTSVFSATVSGTHQVAHPTTRFWFAVGALGFALNNVNVIMSPA